MHPVQCHKLHARTCLDTQLVLISPLSTLLVQLFSCWHADSKTKSPCWVSPRPPPIVSYSPLCFLPWFFHSSFFAQPNSSLTPHLFAPVSQFLPLFYLPVSLLILPISLTNPNEAFCPFRLISTSLALPPLQGNWAPSFSNSPRFSREVKESTGKRSS